MLFFIYKLLESRIKGLANTRIDEAHAFHTKPRSRPPISSRPLLSEEDSNGSVGAYSRVVLKVLIDQHLVIGVLVVSWACRFQWSITSYTSPPSSLMQFCIFVMRSSWKQGKGMERARKGGGFRRIYLFKLCFSTKLGRMTLPHRASSIDVLERTFDVHDWVVELFMSQLNALDSH